MLMKKLTADNGEKFWWKNFSFFFYQHKNYVSQCSDWTRTMRVNALTKFEPLYKKF